MENDSEASDGLSDGELAMLLRQPAASERDRRFIHREAFRCLRAAASWEVTTAVDESTFHQVYCQDLSRRGIGFFSPMKPASESIVIRLSAENEAPLLVAAKVVYCNDRSGNSSFPFVVGCVFTNRLEQ
jgi:hypothetical protein